MVDAASRWEQLQRELDPCPPGEREYPEGEPISSRGAKYLALSACVLEVLNSDGRPDDAIPQIVDLIQKATRFDAVGVRLQEGPDYPYYEARGFPAGFLRAERSLCQWSPDGELVRDCAGAPELDCMCGTVIRGRIDPARPWFTRGGSFWTNSTTRLLSAAGEQPWPYHTRNRCNIEGYESVALVPLRSAGGVVGLLQLNDRQMGRLTVQDVQLLEQLGASVGIALAQRRTETRLRASETVLRATLESLPFDFFMVGEDGRYQLQNSVCRQHWGDVIGRRPGDMAPSAAVQELWESNNRRAFAGETVRGVVEYSVNGQIGHYFNIIGPVHHDGRICGILGLNLDITEQVRAERQARELETRLQRVQKLESLGTLAGQLAHDVNNLLAGIGWNAELALRELPPQSPQCDYLRDITEIVGVAAELTDQLNAYCGRTELQRLEVDLNELLDETQPLIRSGLRNRAEVTYRFAEDSLRVAADRTQLQQVLTNLVVNASEAVSAEGGNVTLVTGCTNCDRVRLDRARPDTFLPDGDYAYLEVIDNGRGMDAATAQRALDPYFTTKRTGRGLGLATVQGIVHSHGGAVEVESRVGHGTTFRVLLPRLPADEPPSARQV